MTSTGGMRDLLGRVAQSRDRGPSGKREWKGKKEEKNTYDVHQDTYIHTYIFIPKSFIPRSFVPFPAPVGEIGLIVRDLTGDFLS